MKIFSHFFFISNGFNSYMLPDYGPAYIFKMSSTMQNFYPVLTKGNIYTQFITSNNFILLATGKVCEWHFTTHCYFKYCVSHKFNK